jgi:hypothetical protein
MSSLTKRSFTLSRRFDPDEICFKIHLITPLHTFFVIHWSFIIAENDSSFLQQLYPSMQLEFRHIFSQCTAMPQGKYPFQAMHIQTINKTTATMAPTPLKANMFLLSPES